MKKKVLKKSNTVKCYDHEVDFTLMSDGIYMCAECTREGGGGYKYITVGSFIEYVKKNRVPLDTKIDFYDPSLPTDKNPHEILFSSEGLMIVFETESVADLKVQLRMRIQNDKIDKKHASKGPKK
jgi:hypothetical protein